jgi:hypothetical protein
MRMLPIWWTSNGACACPVGVECGTPGKHPLTRHGAKDATLDVRQLEAWRAQWPLANWAIATGDGLLVVDLDKRPGKDGVSSFAALGKVPRTRAARTGGGGMHLYFRVPCRVPNTAGKLGPGIDTRGEGGYVLAPGSGHVSGGRYELLAELEPADAPDWLLKALGSTSEPAAPPRGPFPPASAAVLEAARVALERHGPALEGRGGDTHTFRAAAILTHDFALTDSEAWPLFVEWNSDCQPPWSEVELRAKLRGGEKYGKAAYGCARSMDVLETARKLLSEWDQSDGGVLALLEKARALPIDDPAKRALIERDLCGATGLKPRDVNLPRASAAAIPTKHGDIRVSTRLHEVADESIKAIAPHVFSRFGVLCEVVRAERTYIQELEPPRIVDLMSQSARYVREDERRGLVAQVPPSPVASILHARRSHPVVRVLESVTTAPIFLPDGSILTERGYNERARVYLEPSVEVFVEDSPTIDDARESVEVFRDLVGDYKFATPADFSSWLAALLSPLVKAATGNSPAPLFCISAASPGAGKSLLTEVISLIVTGNNAEVRPYNPRDASEWGKRLTAFVRSASPVNVFDNVNGAFGDESLDRLVTSTTWSDRILGASDAPPLPVVGTWFVTGNNLEPVNDTVRRVLVVRIEVDSERPQERTGFKRPLLAEYAREHRADLLARALTIMRAYHLAGRPSQNLSAWGSFVAWSELVRGALVWAGLPDPFQTQQRAARELCEPENDAHDFWLEIVADSDGSAKSICDLANSRKAQEILGVRDHITALFLRRFLGRFVDRPRRGQRIRKSGATYFVEEVK